MFDENHAYSQPLTGSGTIDSIKALTRDDLVSYVDLGYVRQCKIGWRWRFH